VEPELPPALAAARGSLYQLAGELARLQAAAGLPIAEEEYLREVLHPGLMQVRLTTNHNMWNNIWHNCWQHALQRSHLPHPAPDSCCSFNT
jgi:hypothetical protein